eukprot:456162-Pelagomonas_calceolata.AAC.1
MIVKFGCKFDEGREGGREGGPFLPCGLVHIRVCVRVGGALPIFRVACNAPPCRTKVYKEDELCIDCR